MSKREPVARGVVSSLAVNGAEVLSLTFHLEGPQGDKHAGFTRTVSGHDGGYMKSSDLRKGDAIFNWRSWTGLSHEEVCEIEEELGYRIPTGCILENIRISGIPNFSEITPASRLVFLSHEGPEKQAILAVWEENGPCLTAGMRVQEHYGIPGLAFRFVEAANKRRGVMGFVLAPGTIATGDKVLLYPPER